MAKNPLYSSLRMLTKEISINYTVEYHVDTVIVDASGGAVTITLPEISNCGEGRIIRIVKIDSSANAVTISCSGTDTIEGSASITLANQYDKALLQTINSSTWARWV